MKTVRMWTLGVCASMVLGGIATAKQPLMSEAREKTLRKLLPAVSNTNLQSKLNSEDLILYTEKEIPRAHQDWEGALQGIHSPWYNISADGGEPFGNGNREFPWGTPAGTHHVKDLTTFRFLHLPRDENGNRLPIAWYRQSGGGYAWVYPVGAVVGEVLLAKDDQKRDYPFEVRTRTRERTRWTVNAFRPFVSADELRNVITEKYPEWIGQPDLRKLMNSLDVPTAQLASFRLRDRHPGRVSFDSENKYEHLPAISAEHVRGLLDGRVFSSALGAEWKPGVHAPSTKAAFHIVPTDYMAGFIAVDSNSCMRCHQSTNVHVDAFDAGRDWYGRIRGSDGIFSIHPFDKSCISDNGFGTSAVMSPAMIKSGIFARYNRSKHPVGIYNRIPGIR